jgi:hypothetical protein
VSESDIIYIYVFVRIYAINRIWNYEHMTILTTDIDRYRFAHCYLCVKSVNVSCFQLFTVSRFSTVIFLILNKRIVSLTVSESCIAIRIVSSPSIHVYVCIYI